MAAIWVLTETVAERTGWGLDPAYRPFTLSFEHSWLTPQVFYHMHFWTLEGGQHEMSSIVLYMMLVYLQLFTKIIIIDFLKTCLKIAGFSEVEDVKSLIVHDNASTAKPFDGCLWLWWDLTCHVLYLSCPDVLHTLLAVVKSRPNCSQNQCSCSVAWFWLDLLIEAIYWMTERE